jgi:uncharacterized membrane protein
MLTWYGLCKFLHIAGAIVWVGGVVTLAVLSARLTREKDAAVLRAFSRQTRFFGPAMLGPSAGITVLTGVAMLAFMGWRFPLWIVWGLAGAAVSLAFGATFLRRANLELERLSEQPSPDHARLAMVRRQLTVLNLINVAFLLSIVWAMVFDPTL